MTWRGQVWHVFRKDLRTLWPGFAGVAIVAAANAWFASPAAPQGDTVLGIMPGMLLLYAIGGVTVMVLRADAAASPTEFWSTLPLAPSAVATAKIATVGAMLLMVVLAVMAAALSWASSAGSLLALLPRIAAVVLAMSTIGLTFGLASKDRPYFSVIGVLVLQLYMWAQVLRDRETGAIGVVLGVVTRLPTLLWVPVIALIVWTFLQAYRTRHFPRRLSALVACAATAPALMLGRGMRTGAPEPAALAPVATVMSARALWNSTTEDRLEIAIATGDPERGMMRVLEDGVLIVEMRDGTTERLPLHVQLLARSGFRVPAVLPRTGTPVLVGGPLRQVDSTRYDSFWVNHHRTASGRPIHDVSRFVVEGRLADYELREADRLPVRGTRALRQDGRVITVQATHARGDTAGPRIHLAARWLMTNERNESPWPLPDGIEAWHLHFALISPDATIELPLRHADYPGTAGGVYELPGLQSASQRWSLHPTSWSVARPPVSAGWLDSASVIVGTPVFHSAVRVRAIATITPP